MKVLKISLAVIVIAAIVYYVITSLIPSGDPPPPPLPKNQFTERIQQEIDSIGKLPDSKFCSDFYAEVGYHIDGDHKDNRLGKTPLENDQLKEHLTKNLYSAYVEKFISQAFYVFRDSEWKDGDLTIIRREYQILQESKYLEKGSPIDKKITEIQTIFKKYDEIVSFISTCKRFSYSSRSLSDRFPISDVQSKILRMKTYINKRLENEYVNNCKRLRDGLNEIPPALFRSHVSYLDKKISEWSDLYSNYNSQSDYANNLYSPIKKEIEELKKDVYNVSNFDREYKRLTDKWSADNIKAFAYPYPTAIPVQ